MEKNFTVFPDSNFKKMGYNPFGNLIWKVMRISFIQIILAGTLSGLALANGSNAQELLDRKVSLKLNRVTLKKALTELEAATKVKFVYSRNHLDLDDKVS